MPVEVFRGGVNDDISSQGERALDVGGAVGVVDVDQDVGVVSMRDVCNGLDVGHVHVGIGWRFKVYHLRIWA